MTTSIPRLESGDRLNRVEFERRYEAMLDCKKAELVEGVVYIAPPRPAIGHAHPCMRITGWLGMYAANTPGVSGGSHVSNRLDDLNETQPDVVLFIDPECGGQIRLSEDDFLVGPPELVVEVSGSPLALLQGPKRRVFQKHGVKEYLIWRVRDQSIEWYILRNGQYELLTPDQNGVFRSEVFPGLWLHGGSLFEGNHTNVSHVLREGLASVKHRQFVEQLAFRQNSH